MKRLIGRTIDRLVRHAGYKLVKAESHDDRTAACLKYIINSDNPTVLDVGGHHGESIASFLSLWPNATIHSFEPDPTSFEHIRRRFAGNNHVIATNAAVSNHTGTQEFFLQHSTKLNSFHRINLEGREMSQWLARRRDKVNAEEIANTINRSKQVATITLDDYVEANGIKNIDLLKIDTQGHEPEVLDGAKKCLDRVTAVHAEIMFWDMYDRHLQFRDIENLLAPHGFELFSLPRVVVDKGTNLRTAWVEAIYFKGKPN